MDKKTTDIVAYLSWVGLILAFVIGDRQKSKFHINQALVIWLVATIATVIGFLGILPLIGWIFKIIDFILVLFCFVCWFIGFIDAIQGREKPVPVLGGIRLYF